MAGSRQGRRQRALRREAAARLPLRYRLGGGLLVALAALLLAELALAAAGVSPAYQVDRLGQWRMTPDLDGFEMHSAESAHPFRVTTNADGLRTRLPAARSARPRIAVFGDSTVFGWGVDDGQTVVDGIAAGLAAAGRDAEVLNAGQPGYSTTQAVWLLEEVVAGYKPDRALIFLPLHDYNLVLVSDREYLRGGATLAGWARVGLARYSRIYQVLRSLLFPYADQIHVRPNERDGEPRVPRVSDAERAAGLDRARELLAGWGGELMVGLLPFYHDLESPPGRPPPTRIGADWAAEYARSRGVALIDVRACCGPDADALVFSFDKGHLNAAGNARAGAAAGAAIAAAGFPGPQGP